MVLETYINETIKCRKFSKSTRSLFNQTRSGNRWLVTNPGDSFLSPSRWQVKSVPFEGGIGLLYYIKLGIV